MGLCTSVMYARLC